MHAQLDTPQLSDAAADLTLLSANPWLNPHQSLIVPFVPKSLIKAEEPQLTLPPLRHHEKRDAPYRCSRVLFRLLLAVTTAASVFAAMFLRWTHAVYMFLRMCRSVWALAVWLLALLPVVPLPNDLCSLRYGERLSMCLPLQGLQVRDVYTVTAVYPRAVVCFAKYDDLYWVADEFATLSDTAGKLRTRAVQNVIPDFDMLMGIQDRLMMVSDLFIEVFSHSQGLPMSVANGPEWLQRSIRDVERRHVDGRLMVDPHNVASEINVALEARIQDFVHALNALRKSSDDLLCHLQHITSLVKALEAAREEFDRMFGVVHSLELSTSHSWTGLLSGQTATNAATLSRDIERFCETLDGLVTAVRRELKGMRADAAQLVLAISSANVTTHSIEDIEISVEETRQRVADEILKHSARQPERNLHIRSVWRKVEYEAGARD